MDKDNSDEIVISTIDWNDTDWNISLDSFLNKDEVFSITDSYEISYDQDYGLNIGPLEECKDMIPDFNVVKEMCKHYPSLEIAFTKFKEIYQIVEQDYLSKDGNN